MTSNKARKKKTARKKNKGAGGNPGKFAQYGACDMSLKTKAERSGAQRASAAITDFSNVLFSWLCCACKAVFSWFFCRASVTRLAVGLLVGWSFRPVAVELGIACFERVLEVRTREAYPEDWAQMGTSVMLTASASAAMMRRTQRMRSDAISRR